LRAGIPLRGRERVKGTVAKDGDFAHSNLSSLVIDEENI